MAATIGATERTDWEPALVRLYSTHRSALFALAERTTGNRCEAEEAVHDAFVTFHEKGCRPQPGSELAYLRRMVVNRCHSVARREIRGRELTVPNWFGDPTPEDRCLDRLDAEAVREAVAGLPTRQQQVLHLRYVHGMSEAGIAESLGLSCGSVKTHASRARDAMRRVLLPLL